MHVLGDCSLDHVFYYRRERSGVNILWFPALSACIELDCSLLEKLTPSLDLAGIEVHFAIQGSGSGHLRPSFHY
ncbi:hypothetical protein DFJ64_0698 [Thermasporomyces composti]|uniref:Uncharacterized protein n=1 Tax=Thermasporomyces composti TaxID=696763 RepID=A0A3D9V0K4_THECX|nr:hypothetical protein DFJ64_0698 [Thermasporomyces composti]